MSERDIRHHILDPGIIAIVRGIDPDVATDVVNAIVAGGIEAIEITADTSGAVEMIRQVSEGVGENVAIGAGTVLDTETARAVQLAGAELIVTPAVNTDVIETCNRYQIPIATGVMTPTELRTATEAGADFCKLFPASTPNSEQVSAINEPFPQVPLVPTGGISLDNAGSYLDAGATALGVGSALVDDEAIEAADFDKLTETAREFVAVAEAS